MKFEYDFLYVNFLVSGGVSLPFKIFSSNYESDYYFLNDARLRRCNEDERIKVNELENNKQNY
jgi:hypothetical protein